MRSFSAEVCIESLKSLDLSKITFHWLYPECSKWGLRYYLLFICVHIWMLNSIAVDSFIQYNEFTQTLTWLMDLWCECVYVPWLYSLGKLGNHKSIEGRTAAEDWLSYVFRLLLTTGEFHCENILNFLVSTCGTSVMISHDSSLSITAIWYNIIFFWDLIGKASSLFSGHRSGWTFQPLTLKGFSVEFFMWRVK